MDNGEEEKKNDLTNKGLDIALETIRKTVEQMHSLLKNQPISFSLWSINVRYCLRNYMLGLNTPELVELSETLLEVQVEFETEKQKETYQNACNVIREVNALGDFFGSIEEPFSIR